MNKFLSQVKKKWEVRANRKVLNTADSSTIIEILKKYNLLSKIENGKLTCKYCKDPVCLENVYAIFRQSGSLKIVCSKQKCISNLLERN